MARYKKRGNSHCIIYTYKDENGNDATIWETYHTEVLATQRKASIDFYQKTKDTDKVREMALQYRAAQQEKKSALDEKRAIAAILNEPVEIPATGSITWRDFLPVWLPAYIKLKNAKGTTYDSYNSNIQAHILPYFGDKAVKDTTTVSISAFIEHLKNKPCGGSKAYNKKPEEVEKLGSSSIKKCFDILSAALATAKEWKIISEIPEATPPSVKYKKRAYWTPQEALSTICSIDDPVLRLVVHLAYVLTLRPGEVVGLPIDAVQGSNIEIRQEIERMTDKALKATAKEDIIRVCPKKKGESGTQLVFLTPKTEGSVRRLYLNKHLKAEIEARLAQIKRDKQYYGDAYNDCGLLLCLPNGDPVERTRMQRWFKKWQARSEVEIKIDMQGLRKSGAMYKLRLSDYDYQAVQLETGHSTPNVLMEHYNEVMVSEKSRLAEKLENEFYAGRTDKAEKPATGIDELLQVVMADPEKLAMLTKLMALQSVQQ